MSEKIKKNEKAKKQTWRAGNMLYPVPAVMVSCARKGEKPNIITVAWAGTVCSDPAMVSISVRKERYSHDIIKETGEFVINLTTRKLARATRFLCPPERVSTFASKSSISRRFNMVLAEAFNSSTELK